MSSLHETLLMRRTCIRGAVWLICLCLLLGAVTLAAMAQAAQSSTTPIVKAVGEIKSVGGNNILLATDDGKSENIALPENVQVVRVAPGETDLKNAVPITVRDLQNGDRVLVQGKTADDGKSMIALRVVVMKQSDVAAKQQKEREDWQKRGIGGLASEVDLPAGTVTISVTSLAGSKKMLIQTTKNTWIRRYAPNSVKFDDAQPSKLADIHPGDQLRARGNKNEDGTEFTAEEIVAGSFRNIAGTVTAANTTENTLTVMDLLSKKAVVVKIAPDSQMRKLPQMMAQRIAMRLKGQTPPGAPGAGSAPANASASSAGPQGGAVQGAPGGGAYPGGGAGTRPGGVDLQQILLRLPAVTVADFQKGDAVILVSTQGNDAEVTAITLVGGVEPILTAAPAGGQAMVLSPWSLSGAPGEAQ